MLSTGQPCATKTQYWPSPASPHPASSLPALFCLCCLQLLAEYLDSHDAAEASRCLRGLAVPFFHHELVKQGLHAGMESGGVQTQHIMDLLKRCVGGGSIYLGSGGLCVWGGCRRACAGGRAGICVRALFGGGVQLVFVLGGEGGRG